MFGNVKKIYEHKTYAQVVRKHFKILKELKGKKYPHCNLKITQDPKVFILLYFKTSLSHHGQFEPYQNETL